MDQESAINGEPLSYSFAEYQNEHPVNTYYFSERYHMQQQIQI